MFSRAASRLTTDVATQAIRLASPQSRTSPRLNGHRHSSSLTLAIPPIQTQTLTKPVIKPPVVPNLNIPKFSIDLAKATGPIISARFSTSKPPKKSHKERSPVTARPLSTTASLVKTGLRSPRFSSTASAASTMTANAVTTTIPTPKTTTKVFPPSPALKDYHDIKPALEPYNEALMSHPLYNAITSIEQCQVFMEIHAFAVWDFMTLLKGLQINLTSVSLPWVPPSNPELAYFINSIVAGEESDDLGTHSHEKATSHYDLYLAAMKEVGANTEPITFFVGRIQGGDSWKGALSATKEKFPHLPAHTFDFVEYTMQVAENGSVPEIAASFLFGREDPIPAMFQKLLAQFNEKNIDCPNFKLYLARHIEVDGDSHGPMADLMLGKLCTDQEKCEKALGVAQDSIKMRMHLWDGIYSKLK